MPPYNCFPAWSPEGYPPRRRREANINESQTSYHGASDTAVAGRTASEWVCYALLMGAACVYYGALYDRGFNLADEGNAALIAEMMLNGAVPYRDIELGYGPMWYYPIIWAYRLLGVRLVAMKLVFCVVAMATSLCGYRLLRQLGCGTLIALGTALLVLVFPGTFYRTYLPFLVVAGLTVILAAPFGRRGSSGRQVAELILIGVYLALAFMIRPDVGSVMLVLFLLRQLLEFAAAPRRTSAAGSAFKRIAGVLTVAVALSAPLFMHARSQGFAEYLSYQYTAYWRHFATIVTSRLESAVSPVANPPEQAANATVPSIPPPRPSADSSPAPVDGQAGTLLPRAGIWGPAATPSERALAFLTYFPLAYLVMLAIAISSILLRRSWPWPERVLTTAPPTLFAIGAFSLFPQFFFFRPDYDHLEEFMPGLLLLMSYSVCWLGREQGRGLARPTSLRWGFAGLALVATAVFAASYKADVSLRDDRAIRFQAGNRIDVRVKSWEYDLLSRLHAAITARVARGETVVCFPYCPGVVFLAERRTFQRQLYVDDGFLIAQPDWLPRMQREIAERRPRMIVVSDWAINGTEISRFSRWAEPLYRQISRDYRLVDKIYEFELYLLRDQPDSTLPP